MADEKEKKSAPKGIRWPGPLQAEIEATAVEDERDFTKQVIYLTKLGLLERALRKREADARQARFGMVAESGPGYLQPIPAGDEPKEGSFRAFNESELEDPAPPASAKKA